MLGPENKKLFNKLTKREGECLIYTGPGFGEDGFGVFKPLSLLAHRVAFEEAFGYRPKGIVAQTCGRKRCCEETHLEERPLPYFSLRS